VSAGAQDYWDANAAALTFTHPLNLGWLAGLPKAARILDYGCGYGRTLAELAAAGWTNAVGVDFSAAMIERGRAAEPALDLRHVAGLPLAEPDGAFEAVILFAVLTTIPDDGEQRALMAELRRLIRPGGLIYVSDYLLQTDARNLARYEAGAARHGVYGVWDREDGGVFRHQTRAALDALMDGFELVAEADVTTTTFSGAPATAIQRLARRLRPR
jgi:SAM-dependent methyltransferase